MNCEFSNPALPKAALASRGYNCPVILKQLLDILVCPVPECRKPLTLAADESSMQCTGCRRIYPVRDGIPILLVDQAKMPE